jgi:Zn/Cd-binding protein ZinT
MTNKLLTGIPGILLVFSFVLAGCAHRSVRDGPEPAGIKDEPELAGWEGTYNSLSSYLDESSFAAIFVGKDAAKAKLAGFLAADFRSVKVESDTITFYSDRDAKGASIKVSYSRKPIGEPWNAFESDQYGKYKYLIATPPGADYPEGAFHFHLRYGTEGFDALVNGNNLPTLLKADTANDKVREVIEEFLGRFEEQ